MNIRISEIVSPSTQRVDEADASCCFRGPAASLTNSFSANSEFLATLLPDSRRVLSTLNRAMHVHEAVVPSATTKQKNLYSNVALAVDRGVLYLYGYDVQERPLAYLQNAGALGRKVGNTLAAYRPPRRGVLHKRSALAWFYLLGGLDSVMRGFRRLDDLDIPLLPRSVNPQSSATWLETLIPEEVATEIAELLRAVRDCRVPGRFTANPAFGGIGAIAGSDGDWIAGETLVELKCSVAGIKREYVAQLLCYYAFDQLRTHGHAPYHFGRLAVCLPRQRCTVEGSVEEWLSTFGGPQQSSLPDVVMQWCTSRC